MKKMQKLIRKTKITKVIEDIAKERASLQLWQNKEGESRKTNTGYTLRFDRSKKEIIFTSKEKKFDFDLGKVIYCFWEESLMIFKAKVIFMSEYKLAVKIPDYIMTKEKRNSERIDVAKDKLVVNYHLGSRTKSTNELFPFSTNLLDLSNGGIALLVKVANISKFHVGDQLTLKLPQQNNEIFEGRITHISKSLTSLFEGEYSVGVAF